MIHIDYQAAAVTCGFSGMDVVGGFLRAVVDDRKSGTMAQKLVKTALQIKIFILKSAIYRFYFSQPNKPQCVEGKQKQR